MKRKLSDDDSENESPMLRPPKKRICRRSLPANIVTKEVPNYYSGKRVGPGELKIGRNLDIGSTYKAKADVQRKLYLVWVEIRKLKTHPLLLIPGWTGFNITIRKDMVIMEITIAYIDALDSPATDIKTAYD